MLNYIDYKILIGEQSIWKVVYNSNNDAVFEGNRDRNSIKENRFWTPVTARVIRLLPRTWHQHIALRWELFACGMELFVIHTKCL